MVHTQSLQFWYILGVQFTARKPKTLLKTKISAKTTFLGISNNISPRSQEDHRILVKLSKKTPKNCPMGPHQRVIRHSHIAYNKTIHLDFLDTKFHLPGICRSRLYSEEASTFFGSGPNLAHFGGYFGAITLVNNMKLNWNFDHGSSHSCINAIYSILKNSNFYRDRTHPKFEFLVQLWSPFTPWKWPKSKKVNIFIEKNLTISYPNFMLNSLKNQIFQTLEIRGVAINNHIISSQLLPISGHSRTTQ